jgi:hypothetical protein
MIFSEVLVRFKVLLCTASSECFSFLQNSGRSSLQYEASHIISQRMQHGVLRTRGLNEVLGKPMEYSPEVLVRIKVLLLLGEIVSFFYKILTEIPSSIKRAT